MCFNGQHMLLALAGLQLALQLATLIIQLV